MTREQGERGDVAERDVELFSPLRSERSLDEENSAIHQRIRVASSDSI